MLSALVYNSSSSIRSACTDELITIVYFNYVGKPCDSRYLYLDMGVIVELLRIHLLQNAALLIVVLPKAVLLTMNR